MGSGWPFLAPIMTHLKISSTGHSVQLGGFEPRMSSLELGSMTAGS